jgi:hypothetical protein
MTNVPLRQFARSGINTNDVVVLVSRQARLHIQHNNMKDILVVTAT